jgi:hypothetical protein
VRPYLLAGFDVGILARATNHTTGIIAGNAGSADIDEDSSSTGPYHDFEFALAAGVGLMVPAGSTSLFIEAGGTLGMSDVAADEGSKVTSRMLGVEIGVAF